MEKQNTTQTQPIIPNIGFQVVKFDNNKVPEFKEVKGKEYVLYGDNNLYPQYLIELFNRCGKHNAIITGKSQMILGGGFNETSSNELNVFINQCNAKGETLNELAYKVVLDLELFNGAFIEVVWGKASGKIAALYHVDFSKIRISKDKKCFYYCEDWSNAKKVKEAREIDAFNSELKGGRALLYVKHYRPDNYIYPLPDYIGCIPSIESDIEVANFHLNNVKSGFSAGIMVNFNNGIPPIEGQRDIIRKFKSKHQGTDSAGSVIITFNDSADKAPSVLQLTPSDLDKQFTQLRQDITQEIFTGHKITSPMLFGIKTEGQLGGRTELIDAFELFKSTYVDNRRILVEKVFNDLMAINGLPKELELKDQTPISYGLDASVLKDVLTKDEIRKKLGYEPLGSTDNTQNNVTNQQMSSQLEIDNVIAVFSEYGINEAECFVIAERKLKFAIDDTDKKILGLIKDNSQISAIDISNALNIDPELVVEKLTQLKIDGLIDSKVIDQQGKQVIERTITPEGQNVINTQNIRVIETRYKYTGPKDSKNRAFCARLLELNKLYTRDEINTISDRVGYNVWAQRGGYYHNPTTDITTPYCRHNWSQKTVVRNK